MFQLSSVHQQTEFASRKTTPASTTAASLTCINCTAEIYSSLNSHKMPVDFASYLLSASPPGLGYYGFNDEFYSKGFSVKCQVKMTPLKPIIVKPNNRLDDDSEPTSPCSPSPDSDSEGSDDETVGFLFNADPSELSRANREKKRVTFADSKGLALTKVKLVTESSDTPPKLQPQILASLTQGASAAVSEVPPLSLEFPQPASDYVEFRKKLDAQNVCLENVILKDYTVMGTVKVKNLAFEKSVFVRCSFDSWNSSVDIPASYVPCGADQKMGQVMFDTFSFEITVPSTLSRTQVVEFCVCFECDHGQFWDNNRGQNYKVKSAYHTDSDLIKGSDAQYTTDYKPNFQFVDSWSEYSSWSHIDRETPYY